MHSFLCSLAREGLLAEKDGFYTFQGRENLVARRLEYRARARALREGAVAWARWLQFLPFVRGLALTGSVAAEDADPEADVDLLVIVAEGKLSTVFALFGTLSKLTRRRFFCPNFYLSENHMTIRRRNHYVARELAQTVSLSGRSSELLTHNDWIKESLPNVTLTKCPAGDLPVARTLQKVMERILSGELGRRVESSMSGLARNRMRVHYKGEIPPNVQLRFEEKMELRFHNAPRLRSILERYERRREEIAALLTQLSDESEASCGA